MKYIIAFALIAVAMALPEPMRLLEPVQLADPVAPLVVPQEVMDEVAIKVKFVDAPEVSETVDAVRIADVPVENDASDYAVNFVDEAVNLNALEAVEAPVDGVRIADVPIENDASGYAVNFVDVAVNLDAPVDGELVADVPVENDASVYAVNFVDEAVNLDAHKAVEAPVENDASDYAVKFVEEAVNVDAPASSAVDADESPIQIRIVDIPVLDSVVMPLMIPTINNVFLDAPVESNADFAVKFVDVADVDEETPSYMPIKQYPNPMWR